jgi:cellulose synthase operon protein C
VLAIGFGRAVSQSSRHDLAQRWLDPIAERVQRLPLLERLTSPVWGIVLTVVILSLPAVLNVGLGTPAVVAFVCGVAVTALVGVDARRIVARRHSAEAGQASWPPGIVFGLAALPFGAAWAPLPVTASDKAASRVYAAAPVMLGLVALVLFLEGVLLHVPISASLAIAAIVMAASTLLPIAPLDGARLGAKGLLTGVGAIGGAVLVLVGLA